MPNRSDTIKNILDGRKPIAAETEKKIAFLNGISASLQKVATLLIKAEQQPLPDDKKSAVAECKTELDRFLNEALPERTRELSQLQRRFSRPTLNIGVVGNAGQGKSTLLQQLTGLQDEEIPTGAKGDCTGAAAIIENADVSEAYADIEFYSADEFLKQVAAPYYKTLGLPQPSTLDEFAQPLPGNVKQDHYDEVKFVERLQSEAAFYKRYFGESSKRIRKDEIRAYTAKSDKDGNPLSTWAAVKSARVYCRFPCLENEKISVGDTPGLGDRTVLKAEERLMKDFGRNIDAVIMLRKVKERGIRKEDVRLFSLVESAIQELPAVKWSYFMVNVFASDRQTAATAEALKFLPEDFRNSSLKDIQEYIELDCSDREAVLREFDRILDNIAGNQKDLDKILYTKRSENVKQTLADIGTFVAKLLTLFPAQSGDTANVLFAVAKFKGTIWEQLAVKLTELVDKWRDEKDKDNEEFIKNLNALETYLQKTPELPDEPQFKKRQAAKGIMTAYEEFCQKTRRLILNEFDRMDKGFEELFDKLRNEAKECFTAESGGKLGGVVFPQDSNTPEKSWWSLLADEVSLLGETTETKNVAQRIGNALHKFDEATLSFRGFLLPRILPELDTLDTNSEAHRPFAFKHTTVPEIIDSLDSAAQGGIHNACNRIREFAKEPSMSLFATIDELRDAVIRTGSADAAADLWSNFYAEHRSEIWSDIFQKKEADVKFRKEFNDTVMQLKFSIDTNN